MIVNLYIFRTDCPVTDDEWNKRSRELCGSQPENYTCGYMLKKNITDIDCQLVEFCAKENRLNYFNFYVIDSNEKFFIEDQIRMYTNSSDHHKIQNILYCKNKRRIPITTDQPCTCDNQENDYLIPFICVLLVAAVFFFYILYLECYVNRSKTNETHTDTGEKDKFSTVVVKDTLVLGTTERMHGGNNGTKQGINENNDSQNSPLMEELT